ncbi:hypothetical protein F5Y08DRAFT_355289 [Xylaria arbuscula]|nr:hypothetical protein F5Y08DRAFT_355289 [Xylaria arbuscula]
MTQIEFPLSDEDVHCGSSTRSFSVASTGNSVSSPYTPTSGRSTPSLSLSMMMNQATMGCEGLNLAVTPSQTVYGTSVSPTSAEPPHYLGMTYPQYMPHLATPPSEDIPQPQFPTDGYNQYDSMTTAWACPMDSQTLFEERGLSQGNPFMGDGGFPAPFLSVQERSAALHQVQCRSRTTGRARMPMVMIQTRSVRNASISALVLESGKFKCPRQDCDKSFKRQEHLKRHVSTVHERKELRPCQFCGTIFNRDDNFRSHLELHTTQGKGRTAYYPEAVLVYQQEVAKTKQRKRRDGKLAARRNEQRRLPKSKL